MRAALAVFVVLCVSSISTAQNVYLPTGGTQSYVGPSVTAPHSGQVFQLFLPWTPPPPGGYPVLVNLDNSGFRKSELPGTITFQDDLLHDALEAGIAVVSATCTITRGGNTGNPVTYSGNGVFIPPSAGIPVGYAGAIAPYLDVSRPMPQKDAIMLVQHLKWNATTLGIDRDRLSAYGTSSGAYIWMWCVLGPDRSDLWSNPLGQEVENTRLSAAMLGGGVTWWPALAQTKPLANFTVFHLPKSLPGFYDEPAEELVEVNASWLEDISPLEFGVQPGVLELNQALPFYHYYGASNDGTGYAPPSQQYDAGTESDPHSSWSGFAWKLRFPQSRLVLLNPPLATGIEDAVVPLVLFEAVACDKLTWLVDMFQMPFPQVWSTLDAGLAGSNGVPVLTGCGLLQGGDPFTMRVSGGVEFGSMYLFAGYTYMGTPFYGGTLVPTPDLIRFFPLDGSGEFGFSISFPTVFLSGTTLYWQAWMLDAGAVFGASSTNGLASVIP